MRHWGLGLLVGAFLIAGCTPAAQEGAATLELTQANFESSVLQSRKPVLVDFWATWCGPCRQMAPVVEQLADEYGDSVTVGKLNVDANRSLALAHRIEYLPTFVVFKNGREVERIVGGRSKAELARALEKHL